MVEPEIREAMEVDHIGVDLWQAFRAYEARMFAALIEAGHRDVTLADSDVLAFIGPDGTRSVDIAKARHITKQAAQEQAQRLVRKGYLSLRPDPADKRAKRLVLTEKGKALMVALVEIKAGLHAEVAAELGEDAMAGLREVLDRVTAGLSGTRRQL